MRPIDDDMRRVETSRRRLTHDENTYSISDDSIFYSYDGNRPCFGYLWKELLCRTCTKQSAREHEKITTYDRFRNTIEIKSRRLVHKRGRRILERGSTYDRLAPSPSSLSAGDGKSGGAKVTHSTLRKRRFTTPILGIPSNPFSPHSSLVVVVVVSSR